MAIKDILERIERDSKSNAEKILSDARSKAESIKIEYEGKAAKYKKDANDRRKKSNEAKKHAILVNKQLEARKLYLEKKREILDGVFEAARERILHELEADPRRHLKELIIHNSINGNEKIVVPSHLRHLFTEDFIDELNKEYRNTGNDKEGGFSLSDESEDLLWGVKLKGYEETENLSFTMLFDELREEIESEIAARLFPAEKEDN